MKLLLVSVSVGAGHVRAADAVAEALALSAPDAEIRHIDALQYVTPLLRTLYIDGSIGLVNCAPSLYGWIYRRSDRSDGRSPFSDWLQGTQARRLRRAVAAFAPDAILATHFLPPRVLGGRRGHPPIDVLVTDFDFHRLWLAPATRRFFVATASVTEKMTGIGIDAERIRVTGLPVAPGFARPVDRARVLGDLGLDPAVPAILVTTGGAGIATLLRTVRRLIALPPPLQVIAVAGRNEALRRELECLPVGRGATLKVTGFVENMHELMRSADVVVAKPGGLTVAECLASGTAAVFVEPIPGQEEANADFVDRKGAGIHARDADRLVDAVGRLLVDPDLRDRIRSSARELGRPRAAEAVAEAFLGGAAEHRE